MAEETTSTVQRSTMDAFKASFYGEGIASGTPAYIGNAGIRTVGGMISLSNSTNTATFGSALFASTDAPNEFYVGSTDISGDSIYRGILLNRNMINAHMAGHADSLIAGESADAIYSGAVWLSVSSEDTITIGTTVYASTTDGTITTTSSGDTVGKVVNKDDRTGLYLVYLS